MEDAYLRRGAESPNKWRNPVLFSLLSLLVVLLFFFGLMVGPSNMSISESVQALFGNGTKSAVRIVQQIRLPRVLAAILAGGGLAISGLIMQTTLNNDMASPATLGVSNAAVLGANIAIIGLAGGFLSTGNNVANYAANASPFMTSAIAFVLALVSVLLVLGLSRLTHFDSITIILAGIGIGAIWTAATTLLQFYATDVGLSAAVIWSFGDLGRATFLSDWIMLGVVTICFVLFLLLHWRYNALLSGDEIANSLGVKTNLLRFISLFLSSLITACVVSFLGIIGFVGVICPHVAKRVFGQNHSKSLPSSFLFGVILVLGADTIIRAASGGTSFPIGAATSLLGAPFFIYLIISRRGHRYA